MNRDFEEIYRILSLYGNETSLDITEKILHKISEKTKDIFRQNKSKEYLEYKRELTEKFSKVIGKISCGYDQEKCDLCIINKWCNHYRNIQQLRDIDLDAPIYADFFCGAGGLSLGFHNVGFKLSLANDIQECCIDTLALNHPEIPGQHLIAGDINEVLSNISNDSRYNKVDVVVGGPPCQGFSMANRQRIIDDPRNHLYKSFIEAISILNPKFFVMENVRGILSVKDQVIEDFNKIGFSASAHLFNAKEFGIPQNRERVIFIGNRLGIDNENIFREIQVYAGYQKKTVLRDALEGMPVLSAKTRPHSTEIEDEKSGYTFAINRCKFSNDYVNRINSGKPVPILFNHKARYNNERDIEIFGRLNQGDDSSDPKIADIMPYKSREKIFKDKYFKLESDKACKTITAHMRFDCNMYIHPEQARGLTPREAARIQSYPDDYYFRGSYTKTYMQIGNSVPPLLSQAIATVIKKYIER